MLSTCHCRHYTYVVVIGGAGLALGLERTYCAVDTLSRLHKIEEAVKRKLTERYGVKEYWIVTQSELVKMYRMAEKG